MFKKILLIIIALLCITMSNIPAIAVYSGRTETVRDTIQLLAIGHRQDTLRTSTSIRSDTNVQKHVFTGSNAMVQTEASTDSNAHKE